MSNPTQISCSKCGAQIPEEDLTEGLAVTVNGSNICRICVDASGDDAPSAAPVMQRQPLMQQNIYRFTHDDFDDLNRYTFLTAGHIALHRRVEREQGIFDPPELNQDDDTRLLPAQDANKTTHRVHPGNKLPAQQSSKLPVIILGVVAVLVVGLLVALALPNDEIDKLPLNENAIDVPDTAKQDPVVKTRDDFPEDHIQAWSVASQELNNDDPILSEIAADITSSNADLLQQADELLDQENTIASLNILNKVIVPDHHTFQAIKDRKQALLKQRAELIASKIETKTEPDEPGPDSKEPDDTIADTEPLEFQALLQLSSTINQDNTIGSSTKSNLALSTNCSNSQIGDHPAYNIEQDGFIKVNNVKAYPHSFYINFWFKVESNGDNGYQWLYSHGGNNTEGSINIYLTEGNSSNRNIRTVIAYNDMNGLKVNDSDFSMFDQQWHNYALLVDKDKGAFVFIDGELAAQSEKISGPFKPNQELLLGAKSDKSNQLKGSIALVQLYQGSKEPDLIQEKIHSIMDQINADTRWEPIVVNPVKSVIPEVPSENLTAPSYKLAWHKGLVATFDKDPIQDIGIIDYDNDGDNDLLISTKNTNKTFLNKGDGKFSPAGPWDSENSSNAFTSIEIADLNNDGLNDIIELGRTSPLCIFINKGDGTYTKQTLERNYLRKHGNGLKIADMNNDNRPDILFSLRAHTRIILFNTGSPEDLNSWPSHDLFIPDTSSEYKVLNTTIFDLNNDQRLDYLATMSDNSIYAFYNRGFKRFESFKHEGFGAPLKNLKTYKQTGSSKLFALLDNKPIQLVTQEKSFEIIREDNIWEGLPNPINFLDVNNSGTSDFLALSSSKQISFISSKHRSGEPITNKPLNWVKLRIGDLNQDGHQDLILAGMRSNDYHLVSYIRDPDFTPDKIVDDNDINNDTTEMDNSNNVDVPDPTVILSRFEHSRRYKTERVNELIEETPPLYFGNGIADPNFPFGVLARAKGKECTLELELAERDASNGGMVIAIHPRDERRTQLNIHFQDANGVTSKPQTFSLTGSGWQHIAIDLSNMPDDFDSSRIKSLTIQDAEAASSIPFFLYRILIYKDYVPTKTSPRHPPNPLLETNQSNLIKRLKNIRFKQGQLVQTVIISTPHLKNKSDYIKKIRDLSVEVTGKVIPADQSYEMAYDLDWIEKELYKKIIKKHKPSYILFLGVGNNQQSNANSTETITFWQNVVNVCLRNRVLPILCLGPNPKSSRKDGGVYDMILGKGIHEHRSFNFIPILDLTEPKFMKDGNFNQNQSKYTINQIVRSFYLITCRTYEIEEP